MTNTQDENTNADDVSADPFVSTYKATVGRLTIAFTIFLVGITVVFSIFLLSLGRGC